MNQISSFENGFVSGVIMKQTFISYHLRSRSTHLTMRHLKQFLLTLAFLVSSTAHAVSGSHCASDNFLLHHDTLRIAKVSLPVLAHFCYRDDSGNYVVYLTESGDRRYDGETLSSKIGAHLFKIDAGPILVPGGIVNDSASVGMAGVQWWTKLTELNDIDGDGLVDPILVYRFYPSEEGKLVDDANEGRLKIIVFHRNTKAAIRAITGDLDPHRSTTASAPYFKLPPILQTHLVRKMRRMYDEHQFGFDNGHDFRPQK